MKRPISLIGVFLTVALTGCAKTLPPLPTIAFDSMQCSASPLLADALPLSFDSKKDSLTATILDGKAGCLDGPNGSHVLYKIFELPKTDLPYILRVTSMPWGNTILAPQVILLDGAGTVRRTTTHADFSFRGNGLATLLRSHADEKYLVVSADADALGKSVLRINENVSQQIVAAGPAFFSLYTGSDTSTNLILSPAGNVAVIISPIPAS